MWKKAFPILLLCVLFGGLLAGCGETKNDEPFPSEDVFTSEIRDISVQELQDGGYQLLTRLMKSPATRPVGMCCMSTEKERRRISLPALIRSNPAVNSKKRKK